MKFKITAVIPVRKHSERLKNKNFIPFFKKKSLLEIKIEQLIKLKFIDQIVISSDSLKAYKIAKKYKILFHKRDKYFASSKCSGSDFFKNLAENIQSDYIMYCPCTSPIIKHQTYLNFYKKFKLLGQKYDSINTVNTLKTFIWKNNKPINYNVLKAPNSQDLPGYFYSLTFGMNIISRKKMISMKNIVGKNPLFFTLDKLQSTDINEQIEFDFAQHIYRKFSNIL